MTAHSQSRGHELVWDEERKGWVQPVSKEFCADDWECKHCGKKPVRLLVTIPADHSHNHVEYMKPCGIDSCLADIVKALNDGGILHPA